MSGIKKALTAIAAVLLLLLCGIVLCAVSPLKAQAAGGESFSDFLGTFVAYRGKVERSGEGIKYTLGGAGTYIETDTSVYSSGSRWNIEQLSARNTVMLRIKNDSPATRASVWYRNSNKDFDEQKSVEFPLYNDGGWHTYYVNLSEAGASGKLRALRIVPQADSGSIEIGRISFEREREHYNYAGTVVSCTSDGYKVTVSGTLSGAYAGKTVKILRTDISNMLENIDGLDVIAESESAGGNFTAEFPFRDAEVSMLSSTFIATVDGVKVAPMFKIENWGDFTDNPYAFGSIGDVINVRERGAEGDGVTDDTDAIQAAVNEASAAGGGIVLLEGGDGEYGARYVATTIRLYDNVELRIEKGAVLWQSQRESDYKYDVRKGHNVPNAEMGFTRDVWAHNGLTMNYPLVYANGARNIKITGGGAVRLDDTGSVSRVSMYGGGNYSPYCASLIHLVPIGLTDCVGVEVTNINILRTNCYNMVVYGCENVYIGNVTMTECNCLSGDGISIGSGSKNVTVDCCMLYTNDDAIVIVAHSIAEPRGKVWWSAKPDGGDNRIRNVTVRHSAVTPGNQIVLIPWGNDASDWTMQTIGGLDIYDNILGAGLSNSYPVNVWAPQGDPYGKAGGGFVPVYDVRMFDNSYRGVIPSQITEKIDGFYKHGWLSDVDIAQESSIIEPDFAHKLAFWQYDGEYKTDVDVNGKVASINGGAALYQSPRLSAGKHTFAADIKTESGGIAKLFARDAYSGKVIAEAEFTAASTGRVSVEFTLSRGTVVSTGVENAGGGVVYVSAPSIVSAASDGKYFNETFDGGAGKVFVRGGNEDDYGGDAVMAFDGAVSHIQLIEDYSAFDFGIDFEITKNDVALSGYGGLNVDFNKTRDGCLRVRFDLASRKLVLESVGRETKVLGEKAFAYKRLLWYRLGIRCDGDGAVEVYLDGDIAVSAEAEKTDGGKITVSGIFVSMDADNVTVSEYGEQTFDRSVHWREGQGVDDAVSPPKPAKKGCGSDIFADVSLAALALMISVLGLIGIRLFAERRDGKIKH